MFTTTFAVAQSEALKVVVNSLGFYKQTNDINYLARAKKSIDSLIVSRKDSNNIEKNIYKGLVYATILQVDSTNKLNQPANFFATTSNFVDWLATHRRARQYPDELDFIKQCIANACIKKGFEYMNISDFVNAEQYFRKARHYAPSFKPLNAYIAYSNSKLGNLQDAAKFYNDLVLTDSTGAEIIQTAVSINMAIGDTVKALDILKKGRRLLPDDKYLVLDEANIYNNKKDYKALEPLLPVILEYNKNNADIVFVAANCYDQLNRYDKAEDLYLQAVELNSSAFDPAFNLGILYYKKSAFEGGEDDNLKNIYYASKWLEKANEISPNDIKCLQMLKQLYTQTGNVKQLNKIDTKLNQLTDK
ncbi:tetratricopeptide repeat protein [Mucilaginibacter hurinus]|uniref:tetratricopeptide repeat protein n=1 Tax=Mucilaginibacter hurinus TaxID=2201324 RepID=UPI0013147F4A|nr:tetratricopeptide repeat protein [Mucilaginibacter hurinus]